MSRIGRKPIEIPEGVRVSAGDSELSVEGPRGTLSGALPEGVQVAVADGQVRIGRSDDRKPTRSRHGLARALIANMVKGVTSGFVKELQIEGVGYRADVRGDKLALALGFSHPVELSIPAGIEVAVERNTQLRIEGIDVQAVGQFAADVRALRPPEPYKGKGIRYSDERVRRKVGKAGTS